MNKGFFTLSEEKQKNIINAGFKVFAENEYRKAPMIEIALEAGISKSLLFYHFKNKKELYLFLWDKANELTIDSMKEIDVLGTVDCFEMLRRSLLGKINLIINYPYASQFSLRAYNENNWEVFSDIQESFRKINLNSEKKILAQIDQSKLRTDIDIHDMYQEMIWASDGYMHMEMMKGNLDVKKTKEDFDKLISMWERVYRRI